MNLPNGLGRGRSDYARTVGCGDMENQKEIGKPQAYFLNATVKWLLSSPVGFQKGLVDHSQETENSVYVYVYVWCMGYVRLGLPLRRKQST